jgi:hypothetical protein
MSRTDEVRNKVQRILAEDLGSVKVDKDGDFVVVHESAVTFVQVYSRNESDPEADIVINAFCPLIIDVPLTSALYEWVATEGQEFYFGSCRVVKDDNGKTGRVLYKYSIVGNDLDPNELFTLVYTVAMTANQLDNDLQKQFGGNLFGRDD